MEGKKNTNEGTKNAGRKSPLSQQQFDDFEDKMFGN